MALIPGIERTLYKECGFQRGQSVLVACSGGSDSVCLLKILNDYQQRWGISRLGVYHLNHRLRGKESDDDARFVSGLAASLDLPFFTEEQDVAAHAAAAGESLEMAGRRLRYEGLSKVLKTHDYDLAALGHTASDNVEWILLSLIRGRAEPLLWGIPARRDSFIRPLIRTGRQQILSYLAENNVGHRHDSSNDSADFIRNRIRNQVLPLLKELNPSLEDTLTRTLITGDYVNLEIENRAEQVLNQLVQKKGKNLELDTRKLCQYNPVTQLRVIRLFVPWLSSHEICEIFPLKPFSGTREIARKGGRKLMNVYERLVLTDIETSSRWDALVLDAGTQVAIPGLGWRLGSRICHGNSYKCLVDEVYFDADMINLPLKVRPWREGDRMVPFGRHGSVKLKKIFTDYRVPREERSIWPVVYSGDDVLWVVGLVRSVLAPVTESTCEVLILTVLRGENGK